VGIRILSASQPTLPSYGEGSSGMEHNLLWQAAYCWGTYPNPCLDEGQRHPDSGSRWAQPFGTLAKGKADASDPRSSLRPGGLSKRRCWVAFNLEGAQPLQSDVPLSGRADKS
jgi:hypothetical protein